MLQTFVCSACTIHIGRVMPNFRQRIANAKTTRSASTRQQANDRNGQGNWGAEREGKIHFYDRFRLFQKNSRLRFYIFRGGSKMLELGEVSSK